MTEISNILNEFSPVTLKEMDSVKLMTRTDTKYLLHRDKLSSLLKKAKECYRILEIDNKREIAYRTTYFDTKDFSMYIAHQNGKLNRYKIRYREYVDSNTNFLEVKFKSNKQKTIKKRIKRKKITAVLSKKEQQFVEKKSPYSAAELELKLATQFSRLTLVHKKVDERLTIDFNLRFTRMPRLPTCPVPEVGKHSGGQAGNDNKIELPFLAVVEVKQTQYSRNSDFVQFLHEEKIQPVRMSKYCIGTILLNKDIKYNRFKRKLLILNKICNDSNYSKLFIRN